MATHLLFRYVNWLIQNNPDGALPAAGVRSRSLVGQVGVRVGQQRSQRNVSNWRGGAPVLDLVKRTRNNAKLRIWRVADLHHQGDAHYSLRLVLRLGHVLVQLLVETVQLDLGENKIK